MAMKGGPTTFDIGTVFATRRHMWEVVGFGRERRQVIDVLAVCSACDEQRTVQVASWRVPEWARAERVEVRPTPPARG